MIFVNFHKISSKTDASKTTTPGQQPADRAPDPRPDSAEHFLVSSDVPPRKCRVAPNQHLASSKDNVSVDKCQARGAPKIDFQKSPAASPQHHGHRTQKENQPFFFSCCKTTPRAPSHAPITCCKTNLPRFYKSYLSSAAPSGGSPNLYLRGLRRRCSVLQQ